MIIENSGLFISNVSLQRSPAADRFIYRMARKTLNIMKADEIGQLNEANLVLRHFVNLSAKLLPFLDELQRKQNPTLQELQNKNKIMDVFESYNFDTTTSEMLVGSDVLELIRRAFEHISQTSYFLRPGQTNPSLVRFLKEYHRLQYNWDQNAAN